jgi:hypothetical protein
MSYYRLYFRDYEGHFCGCRQFEAPDAEEPTACVRDSRTSELVYQGRGRALNAHRQIGFFWFGTHS